MMKRLIFGVITPLSFCLLMFHAHANQGQDKSGPFRVSEADPLQKLMEAPAIKERLELCRAEGVAPNKLDECLWKGNLHHSGKVPPMDPNLQSQITSFLKQANREGQPKGEQIKDPAGVVEHFEEKKDPAIVKLEEYLTQRLRQALYGEVNEDLAKEVGKVATNNDNSYRTVDHQVFHELYKNQITQNIISSISSYCIEATESAKFTIDKDKRDAARTINMRILQDQTRYKDKKTNETIDTITAYSQWSDCLENISKICYANNASDYCGTNSGCNSHYDYSKTRACAVTRAVRGARQAILANDEIIEAYKNGISGPVFLEHTNKNLKVVNYDSTNPKTSISRISTFSSGEIMHTKNEFSNALQGQIAKLKECYDDTRPEGQKILDEEACREFISEDREQQEEILAEISMRTRAVAQQLDGLEDEDQVKEFLMKEGHTDDQAEHLITSAKDLQELKNEINQRYEAERVALIQQMAAQIEQRSVSEGTPLQGKAIEDHLQKISQELNSREKSFKELVHYNNIVSGFLTIKEKDETRLNSEVIMRELAFSAYNPELPGSDPERAPSALGADYFEKLNQALQPSIDNASSNSKAGAGSTVFGISDINKFILKYKNLGSMKEENR